MAGSSSTSSAQGFLAAGLGLGLAGACTVLLGFFGLAGDLGGAGAMVLAAILTAPFDRHPAAVIAGWWQLLVAGALLTLVGIAIALGLAALGGFLVVGGSIAVLVACVFGPLAALPRGF